MAVEFSAAMIITKDRTSSFFVLKAAELLRAHQVVNISILSAKVLLRSKRSCFVIPSGTSIVDGPMDKVHAYNIYRVWKQTMKRAMKAVDI